MSVAIVQYNAGNVRSVTNALERLGVRYVVTNDEGELMRAERVIFPGVGEAASAMTFLRERGLDRTLRLIGAPMLGICLGMQLLCSSSEEGNAACLGVIGGQVARFRVPRKVPHIGWSRVYNIAHPVFEGLGESPFFYFVHSYRLDVGETTIARCLYGEEFSAAVAYKNFVGVQFHPEKSSTNGERLLQNFLEWKV